MTVLQDDVADSRIERALTDVMQTSSDTCMHAAIRSECHECRSRVMAAMLIRTARERLSQDAKWGVQDHSPYTWLVILMEEVGEAAEASLALGWAKTPADADSHLARLEQELAQVAAVAVAFQECLARGDWRRRPGKEARQ